MSQNNHKQAAGPRYLTFEVEGEVYGIPILKVKEILGIRDITPLPQTAPSVRGILNLRGTILPVVDLRITFGLAPRADSKRTSIVVLDLSWDGEPRPMGIVVDSVHEVQAIPDEKVSKLAGLETRVKARYVVGVADTPAGIRILIDVDKILTEEDLTALQETAAVQ